MGHCAAGDAREVVQHHPGVRATAAAPPVPRQECRTGRTRGCGARRSGTTPGFITLDRVSTISALANIPGVRAALSFALILATGLVLRRLARRHSKALGQASAHWAGILLRVLARTSLGFLAVAALAAALPLLSTDPDVRALLHRGMVIVLFWQLGLWLVIACEEWLQVRRQRSIAGDKAALGTLAILGAVIPVVIWALMVLLALDNLGVNVTTLIAGLGIGGVAIALATQNVLGDLLASLSIAFDKPFVIGDFVVLDNYMGRVEYIGMKSTRLRSLSGEQIVISNANMLSSKLRNFGRMSDRRVQFTLSVRPDTPCGKLRALPAAIAEILKSQPEIHFDRCHIASISGSGVDIECVYVVGSTDYDVFMDVQEKILLRIQEALEKSSVGLADSPRRVLLEPPVADDAVVKT